MTPLINFIRSLLQQQPQIDRHLLEAEQQLAQYERRVRRLEAEKRLERMRARKQTASDN